MCSASSRAASAEGRLAFWQALAPDRGKQFAVEEVAVAGDAATIRWRYRFGDGDADSVRGVNRMQVRDGRIVRRRDLCSSALEVVSWSR